jgi:[ribosomal protein S18]-alanine N-acetyltransferase
VGGQRVTSNIEIIQILADSPQATAAAAIMAQAFTAEYGEAWQPRELVNTLALPNVDARLGLLDREPSGFSLLYHLAGEAEILMVAVKPELRGRGIASALLADMIQLGQMRGHETLFLEVRDGNATALKLYERYGFEISGRRHRYYRGSDAILRDAITMRRSLRKSA